MENPQRPEKRLLQKIIRFILWGFAISVIGMSSVLLLYVVSFFAVPSFLAHQQLPEPYPNSHLIQKNRNGATCCLWDIYTYETDDSVETVKTYLEESMPGFRHPDTWWGKKDIDTSDIYINGRCDTSWLAEISRPDVFPNPCVRVDIYPNWDNEMTTIIYEASWSAP